MASLGPAPAASGGRRPGVAAPATPKEGRGKQQGGCCPPAHAQARPAWPGLAPLPGCGQGGAEAAPARGGRPPQRRRREGAAAPSKPAHRGPGGPLAAPKAAGIAPAAVSPPPGVPEEGGEAGDGGGRI